MIPVIPPKDLPDAKNWVIISPFIPAADDLVVDKDIQWFILIEELRPLCHQSDLLEIQTVFAPAQPSSWPLVKDGIRGERWVLGMVEILDLPQIVDVLSENYEGITETPAGLVFPSQDIDKVVRRLNIPEL